FVDSELRTTGPLLPAQRWVELLRDCGFPEVATVEDDTGDDTAPHTVLFATAAESAAAVVAPAVAVAEDWVILGDDAALAGALARRLREHGGRALVIPPGEPVRFGDRPPDRIVQLWNTGDADADDPA